MKQHVAFAVLMAGIIIAAAHCTVACAASQEQKNAAADSAYAADQADCVRIAHTRQEADSCRAARRGMWKVDAGMIVTDGGVK